MKLKSKLAMTCLLMGVGAAGNALAGAVIYNTGDPATATVALGVNDEGHLNTSPNITSNASATGLAFKFPDGTWQDATSPGCLCEGWGVSGNGTTAGYADVAKGGVVNLAVDSFTSTASTATSVVHLVSLPGLKVTHRYQPSASSALFEAVVTIENTGTSDITDVRYRRAMDWDIPPSEFNEYVTIRGTGSTTLLLNSGDNGFVIPNPLYTSGLDLRGCGLNTDFTDCGPADHGAVFDFGFGDLAAGDSHTFSIFYGAAPTEKDAIAALTTVGAELYSLGQSAPDGTPATYIFGFKGVGGTPVHPVPEPEAIALLGLGMIGLLAGRRRKRA